VERRREVREEDIFHHDPQKAGASGHDPQSAGTGVTPRREKDEVMRKKEDVFITKGSKEGKGRSNEKKIDHLKLAAAHVLRGKN